MCTPLQERKITIPWKMFLVTKRLHTGALGPSIVAHVLILIGLFFTLKTFTDNKITHRDLYKDKDGGARYDDIWGG